MLNFLIKKVKVEILQATHIQIPLEKKIVRDRIPESVPRVSPKLVSRGGTNIVSGTPQGQLDCPQRQLNCPQRQLNCPQGQNKCPLETKINKIK
jgi:hypothetical protein